MCKKLLLLVLVLGLVGTAKAVQEFTFTATGDIWIREKSPDATYEDDLLSCWSSESADAARRYGLFEFDISSLAGESLISATLSLYSINDWSQATKPIKQYAYNIASGGVTSLTWNTYMSGKDAGKTQLTGLGHYDLGPIDTDPSQQNVYVDSDAATSADLTLLENEASGDGILSLVLIAVEDGTDYRRDWGDIGYLSQPAKLNVIIPEPATVVLLGLGGLALLRSRKRS